MKDVNTDNGHRQEIKYVNDVSCVDQLSSVKSVTNVPTVTTDLLVAVTLHQFWGKLGVSSKVVIVLMEGYTLPFPAKFDQVTHHYKLLSKSSQEPLPGGGIASVLNKNALELVTTRVL